MNSSDHPDLEILRRHLDEETGADEAARIDEHLCECGQCQERMTDLAADESWWDAAPQCLTDDRRDVEDVDCDIATTDQLWFVEHQQVKKLLAPSDDPQMIGRIGGYEVVGIVGAGATAVVLKAFDRALNRSVAVKLMRPTLAASSIARKRFAREARAAASIVHENVIEIYGVSEIDGLPYLVMPYVRGESLARRIERSWPLPVDAILHIACQVADGLAAAHEKGLVHRDVKPSNILLGEGIERLKLTDFGLARAVDEVGLTRSGTLAGTPEYMSPEQARGADVDHACDLFSLGSVIYAMCTGRPPFSSDSCYGVLRRIVEEQPVAIEQFHPELPAYVLELVRVLMEKDPGQRYANADQVARDLRTCLLHHSDSSHPLPQRLSHSLATQRRVKRWLQFFGALMVATVVTVGTMLVLGRPVTNGETSIDVVTTNDDHELVQWDDGIDGSLKELQSEIDGFQQQFDFGQSLESEQ